MGNCLRMDAIGDGPDDVVESLGKTRFQDVSLLGNLRRQLGGQALSIVVVGASGHLAKEKIFPALFALFKLGALPPSTKIIGYARSNMTLKALYKRICSKLLFRDENERRAFLGLIEYHRGQYDSASDFSKLDTRLRNFENNGIGNGNRVFYFAVPPTVFGKCAKAIREAAIAPSGWTRVVIEKPFGRNLQTSNALSQEILSELREDQIYRIDHYLAKEMVQNIISLRFSNPAFKALWSNKHIETVRISFKEDAGVNGRGGYYDQFGATRDVIQNHLLQVLSLIAMEPPVNMTADAIRNAKVNVLRDMPALVKRNFRTGQYIANETKPGYLDDKTVENKGSNTETYAKFVARIDNPRWQGVDFICEAGKAMDERLAEVRIVFKDGDSMANDLTDIRQPVNELVIRIQPDEAVWLEMNTKEPGLKAVTELVAVNMDLNYKKTFRLDQAPPDAYTRLLIDVLRGDHSLFVRADELQEAWRIVDPVLSAIESGEMRPTKYVRGSRYPLQKQRRVIVRQMDYSSCTSSEDEYSSTEVFAVESCSSDSETEPYSSISAQNLDIRSLTMTKNTPNTDPSSPPILHKGSKIWL